jgi:transcriptional regulator with XRE-family HTH domain
MARSALRWTVQDLAERTSISRATIARFEVERGSLLPALVHVIRQVFEAAGVRFIDDPAAPGVACAVSDS